MAQFPKKEPISLPVWLPFRKKTPAADVSAATGRKGVRGLEGLLLFALVFGGLLGYSLLHATGRFYHDSNGYWELAHLFEKGGRFAIANYSDDLRGYLFPLLLYFIQKTAALLRLDSAFLFYVFNSLLFAVLALVVLPAFLRIAFNWKAGTLQKLFFALILFYFWKGSLLYPLTDFPALTAALAGGSALVLLARRARPPLWAALLAGLGLAAASNIRPVYNISLLLAAAALLVLTLRGFQARKALNLLVFLLGVSIVFAGQAVINQTHFGVRSPFVQARVDGENLYIRQLFIGLRVQRFETIIGESSPRAYAIFGDEFYKELKKLRPVAHEDVSGYFQWLAARPFDFARLYFRHAFNGMDTKFDTVYVPNLYGHSRLFSLLNYTILFLAGWYLFSCVTRLPDLPALLALLLALSPVALAIPTAVEIRFFLAAYILAYAIVSYRVLHKDALALLKAQVSSPLGLLRLSLFYALFVLACFALSSYAFESAPL